MPVAGRFAYLAQPMDQARGDGTVSRWASLARTSASEQRLGLFSPGTAFVVPEGLTVGPEIEMVNRAALARSCGVIALLPRGVPTIGVPIEIERAAHQEIPVAVVTDADSWSLAGLPGVRQFRVEPKEPVLDAIEDAVKYIAELGYSREERRSILPFARTDAANGNVILPTRAHHDDAGLDLYATESVTIPVGQFRDIPTGIAVEMQSWNWGLVIGRSSTWRNRGLIVMPSVIDPGYRGELFSAVHNSGERAQTVQAGERVAQLVLMGNQTQAITPVMVEALRPSARGEAGFGSSGT